MLGGFAELLVESYSYSNPFSYEYSYLYCSRIQYSTVLYCTCTSMGTSMVRVLVL